jgi:hypothetical protein
MSASQGRALHTIALQLLEALDPYERDIDALLRRWPDDGQFRRVWQHAEQIRLYSAALAAVRVQSTSVLIGQAELVRLLCRAQDAYEVGLGRDISQARAEHRDTVAALRYRLQWMINRAALEPGLDERAPAAPPRLAGVSAAPAAAPTGRAGS